MRALLAVLLVAAPSQAPAQRADAASGCQAQYQVNEWSGGFTATVTVTAGSTPLSGWTVSWTYAGDQRVTSAWNATVNQSGSSVTATNVAWNGSVPAGGSTQFGLQGTFTRSDAAPTNLTVSGCGTQSPPATGVTDGFEGPDVWHSVYPDCQGSGTAGLDTGVFHSGTRSLKVTGAAGYCNHVFMAPDADLSEVGPVWYGRFYVRHTTALPAQHVTFLAMRDTADGHHDLRMAARTAPCSGGAPMTAPRRTPRRHSSPYTETRSAAPPRRTASRDGWYGPAGWPAFPARRSAGDKPRAAGLRSRSACRPG